MRNRTIFFEDKKERTTRESVLSFIFVSVQMRQHAETLRAEIADGVGAVRAVKSAAIAAYEHLRHTFQPAAVVAAFFFHHAYLRRVILHTVCAPYSLFIPLRAFPDF